MGWLLGIGVQVIALIVGLVTLVVVFAILKARRPIENEARLQVLANNITESVLAAILVGVLVFVTLRYS
jgi:hypothetical protein